MVTDREIDREEIPKCQSAHADKVNSTKKQKARVVSLRTDFDVSRTVIKNCGLCIKEKDQSPPCENIYFSTHRLN